MTTDSDLRAWLVICDRMVGPVAAAAIAPMKPAALLLVPGDGKAMGDGRSGLPPKRQPRRRRWVRVDRRAKRRKEHPPRG